MEMTCRPRLSLWVIHILPDHIAPGGKIGHHTHFDECLEERIANEVAYLLLFPLRSFGDRIVEFRRDEDRYPLSPATCLWGARHYWAFIRLGVELTCGCPLRSRRATTTGLDYTPARSGLQPFGLRVWRFENAVESAWVDLGAVARLRSPAIPVRAARGAQPRLRQGPSHHAWRRCFDDSEAVEGQQQLVKQPSKCELSFAQIVQSITRGIE